MFCTRTSNFANGQEMIGAVMTIFFHQVNLHCHKHSDQTSYEHRLFVPDQM